MLSGKDEVQEHERLRDLCALASSGSLTMDESAELRLHLTACEECQRAVDEYAALVKEGMPKLAARFALVEELQDWDDASVGEKIFSRVAQPVRASAARLDFLQWRRTGSLWILGVAATACLAVGASVLAYRSGRRAESALRQSASVADAHVETLLKDKKELDELVSADRLRIGELEAERARKQGEMEGLRSALDAADRRANESVTAKSSSEEETRLAKLERDALTAKLQDLQQSYEKRQSELVSLEAENREVSARSASLQKQIEDLSATTREQQQRIGSDDQYLSADRDIRELMGARQLYIADVFDVSSDSRRRKPYGRIFYTKGKSLIFYAFDLDQQPRVINAAAFQAWGKSESGASKPVSLGILYLDNEANRRWALRCDAPEQLTQIDAVFVTVEPHGGSEKPTGKPFLYASLRKEPNHP
jgi:hypothetical protein